MSFQDPILNAQAQYHTHVRGEVAAVISLAVALMLCSMALFRVGSLMKFISPSVLTGFVTGRCGGRMKEMWKEGRKKSGYLFHPTFSVMRISGE